MGDRANIVMDYGTRGRVYFYGHWSGGDYAAAVQRALAKQWRWDDESYLARIVFDEFVGKQQGSETSFGISPFITDNEHPILVVRSSDRTVLVESEGGAVLRSCTFAEYVALKDPQGWVCR